MKVHFNFNFKLKLKVEVRDNLTRFDQNLVLFSEANDYKR